MSSGSQIFYKGAILALLFSGIFPQIFSQEDSLFHLEPVSIEASALRQQEVGCFAKDWRGEALKQYSHASVGDLLSTESGAFIKTYGGGSLATSSIRGAGAGHTNVIWNGLPIASPMLGQLDFSLLPVGFVDELQLQYGGNTALWGSGAIGGTIIMNNHLELKPSISLEVQHLRGSFGQKDYQTDLQYANKNFGLRIRSFQQESRNDFFYELTDNLPLRQQTNAYYRREGILQEFFWKTNSHHRFSLHTWLQNTYREIPPTMVQNRNEAFQEDQFLRLSLNYRGLLGKNLLRGKVGYFHEKLDYQDPLILLSSQSQFQTILGEVEVEREVSKHKIVGGLYLNHTKAISDGYQEPPVQNNIALFITDRFDIKSWNQQISFRQEWVDGNWVLPVISWGTRKAFGNWGELNAKISRNYRLPTLNDRFWAPGGNPDLKPESGWSEEINLKLSPFESRKNIHYTIGLFNRNIHNWILWSIRDGENFWSANNLAKVWSRGIEQRLKGETDLQDLKISLEAGYHYTLSTNQETIRNPKIEAGSQLVYVPKHQVFGQIGLQWKDFQASYQYRYTSAVNTVNLDILPHYHLAHLRMNYQWESSFISGDVSFQIDNLWDVPYQVVERRPMPGRSFLAGVSFRFENPS